MKRPECALPNCRRAVRVLRRPAGQLSRYCSLRHARACWCRDERGKAWRKRYTARRRHEVTGKLCMSCACSDAEAHWPSGGVVTYCASCAKQVSRTGPCPSCGKARRKRRVGPRSYTAPLCADCDGEALRAIGLVPVILIHPVDDRERTIWRRGVAEFEVWTATEDQWRRWRT